jgi:hypothetical protein
MANKMFIKMMATVLSLAPVGNITYIKFFLFAATLLYEEAARNANVANIYATTFCQCKLIFAQLFQHFTI